MPKKYQGNLLIANPSNPKDFLNQAVLLLVTHTDSIGIALQINAVHEEINLTSIGTGMGIPYIGKEPVWYGGNISVNKIHVVHSLDWRSMTTVALNKEIGITNDIGVLSAISQGQGPMYFKACAGYWLWEEGKLDEMLNPRCPNPKEPYRWEIVPANMENVFEIPPEELWMESIKDAAKLKVSEWL